MYATAYAHIQVQSTGIVYSHYEKIVYDTIIRDAEIKLAYSALHEHLRQENAAKDGMMGWLRACEDSDFIFQYSSVPTDAIPVLTVLESCRLM